MQALDHGDLAAAQAASAQMDAGLWRQGSQQAKAAKADAEKAKADADQKSAAAEGECGRKRPLSPMPINPDANARTAR